MPDIKPTNTQSLSLDLLALYDNISEFEACCAFFCDAVSALISGKDEWIDDVSADGLRLYAQTLKDKSAVIKGEVEVVWKTAASAERH